MRLAINFHSGPVLGALFFALASSAVVLTRLDGGIALLWVANAPLLMGLCRTDVRRWWRLLIWVAPAAIGASILFGPVAWAAPFLAVASLVEALLAATLLRRLAVDCDYFRSGRSVLLFSVIAGLAAPMAGGLIAASVAAASLDRAWTGIYLDWVLGHGLGMLIGSPVMLLLDRSGRPWLSRSIRVNRPGIAALALVGVTAAGVFSQERLPLMFLPALPILLATFRLGRRGATLAMMLVAFIGAVATTLHHGPIVMTHLSHVGQLQFFQFYLVATFAMSLPVASALEQVRLALARTREANRLFGMAGQIASIGYWRWDVRANVITWSDEVFRIFGVAVGPVPPLSDILGFYHPTTAPAWWRCWRRCSATGSSSTMRHAWCVRTAKSATSSRTAKWSLTPTAA